MLDVQSTVSRNLRTVQFKPRMYSEMYLAIYSFNILKGTVLCKAFLFLRHTERRKYERCGFIFSKLARLSFKMRGKISIKECINELEEKSTKIVGQKNAIQGQGKNPRTY